MPTSPARRCSKCGETKPAEEFHLAHGSFLRADCATCRNTEQQSAYVEEKAARRDKRLQRTYGITSADYEALLDSQSGGCAICGRVPAEGKQQLSVDHDHKTGLVRGLLCWHCNHRLLGGSRDDPERLRRAANYLESPPAIGVIGKVIAPAKPKRKRRKRKV